MHKTLKTKNKEVPRPFLLCFLLFFSFKLMVLGYSLYENYITLLYIK